MCGLVLSAQPLIFLLTLPRQMIQIGKFYLVLSTPLARVAAIHSTFIMTPFVLGPFPGD